MKAIVLSVIFNAFSCRIFSARPATTGRPGVYWRARAGGDPMSKEATMPTYVSLLNWTDQGIKTVKDSVDRAE